MISASKIKCPHCGRQIMKKVIAATKGKCNNCGYLIAGSMSRFLPKPKSTIDIINSFSV